jgi:hypothetical protein
MVENGPGTDTSSIQTNQPLHCRQARLMNEKENAPEEARVRKEKRRAK